MLPNCVLSSQFARQYSRNEPLTFAWLRRYIKWPLLPPKNIKDLMDLEAVHDVFDLYLWLRYQPFSSLCSQFSNSLVSKFLLFHHHLVGALYY